MLTKIAFSQMYVPDQDQALDFYVGKLGFEVRIDQDFGAMRFLVVGIPGDPDHGVLLERPGTPSMDEKTAEQVREVLSKGASGGHLFLNVDDCRKTYEDWKARGVEFSEEPTEQPYGIDCGLRDPFGNHIRISQPIAVPA